MPGLLNWPEKPLSSGGFACAKKIGVCFFTSQRIWRAQGAHCWSWPVCASSPAAASRLSWLWLLLAWGFGVFKSEWQGSGLFPSSSVYRASGASTSVLSMVLAASPAVCFLGAASGKCWDCSWVMQQRKLVAFLCAARDYIGSFPFAYF